MKNIAIQSLSFATDSGGIVNIIAFPDYAKVKAVGLKAGFGPTVVAVSGTSNLTYVQKEPVENAIIFPSSTKLKNADGDFVLREDDETTIVVTMTNAIPPQDDKDFNVKVFIDDAGQDRVRSN